MFISLTKQQYQRLSAFTDYIFNQVKNVERLSSETAYGSCVADIAAAEEHIGIYMADENEDSSDAFKGNTIGDFISMIIQRGRSQWFPYVISARDFLDKVFAAYDMINIFFMDLIRNTLIPTDRDLFKVQISTGTKSHILEGMHFEECYENPLNLG